MEREIDGGKQLNEGGYRQQWAWKGAKREKIFFFHLLLREETDLSSFIYMTDTCLCVNDAVCAYA